MERLARQSIPTGFDRPTLNFHSNAQGSYLAVANAGSETTSLYQVSAVPVPGAV
ncbi:hypothetical protein [Methylomonas koyamae]|uniref:hypothetical protein n=1 Tax=Methylomonas koyamae TaxID=702114 RepID=UPI000A7E4A59|nr:hypothetical protein [Methylomonas koyamae]BBL57387.1 hypothetical protein MKFW12EY_10000 [Methylomonas koyamae]